jgi:hypothetical protein
MKNIEFVFCLNVIKNAQQLYKENICVFRMKFTYLRISVSWIANII